MSGGITVKEFKHIPGVNDAEYIKKLEELHEIDKGIISKAVAKIKMLSAQSERKTGRWIPTYEDCCADVWVKWKCSECGYVRKKGWKQTYYGAKPDALFCEMCNADMRGEQE